MIDVDKMTIIPPSFIQIFTVPHLSQLQENLTYSGYSSLFLLHLKLIFEYSNLNILKVVFNPTQVMKTIDALQFSKTIQCLFQLIRN